jgi:hypothetical protein
MSYATQYSVKMVRDIREFIGLGEGEYVERSENKNLWSAALQKVENFAAEI